MKYPFPSPWKVTENSSGASKAKVFNRGLGMQSCNFWSGGGLTKIMSSMEGVLTFSEKSGKTVWQDKHYPKVSPQPHNNSQWGLASWPSKLLHNVNVNLFYKYIRRFGENQSYWSLKIDTLTLLSGTLRTEPLISVLTFFHIWVRTHVNIEFIHEIPLLCKIWNDNLKNNIINYYLHVKFYDNLNLYLLTTSSLGTSFPIHFILQ